MKIGAIEAGGTKMICAVGNEKGQIYESVLIPTREPSSTIKDMVGFFEAKQIEALGIACFGPIELNRNSPKYGYITTTPKEGWADTDMVGAFKCLNVPIGFDTDVNGSVLGEYYFGEGKGLENLLYVTIGTGIGAGIISGGKTIHGMLHPEAGHMILNRASCDADFESCCLYHDNCMEGMCSGPSMKKRWGKEPYELVGNAEAWDLEAFYIAEGIYNMSLVLSPQRIILGGGVMEHEGLIEEIRTQYGRFMNGYIKADGLKDLKKYIVTSKLDGRQGILGALKLGETAGS